MNNIKLTLQYDGTAYSGWQIQENADTIQMIVTDSIQIIIKERINLIGSGRTDTGVHALGQVANFRTEQKLDLYRFKHSLNSVIPNDISVLSAESADEDFHSRFSAKKRTYIYLISKHKSPFFHKYSYYHHNELNLNELNQISKAFIGKKDFTSFSKKNENISNKLCEVYTADWYERDDLVIFEISANRFLHGMVRAITGTIIRKADQKGSVELVEEIFKKRNRETAPMSVPAKGLFLSKVTY